MKRMQRLRDICTVLDRHLANHMDVSNASPEAIYEKVMEVQAAAFGDKVPESFSWTRHAKVYKEHESKKNS